MRNRILQLVFLCAVLCMAGTTYASVINVSGMLTPGGAGSGQLKAGATLTVEDVGGGAGYKYNWMRGKVILGIDWGLYTYNTTYPVNQSVTVEVILVVNAWKPTGAQIITNQPETLRVNYNPVQNTTEIDKAIFDVNGARKIKIDISQIKVNGLVVAAGGTLPAQIYAKTEIDMDRYQPLSATTPSPTLAAWSGNQRWVGWSQITGAEEYDLEWTLVDAYDNMGNPTHYDFTNNSTRVRLTRTSSNPSYRIPFVFPSGWIIVRVRAIGRDTTSLSTVYGNWSVAASGTIASVSSSAKYQFTEFDAAKNWEHTSVYAENGKRIDNIAYFDGSLRERQNLTRAFNHTDSAAIVGQTIYDYLGRPTIQVLPVPSVSGTDGAPVDNSLLTYRNKFNRNPSGVQYSYQDFDIDYSGSCGPTKTKSMSTADGASKYYSSNQYDGSGGLPLEHYLPQHNTPNAQGYPFVQVEYMPDNTGRVRRQGGVGPVHRLSGYDETNTLLTGKESRYYYTIPYQEQLDRLFGSEVGLAVHYKKNAVVDANGQFSVTYIDPYGRVIATALAGDTTNTPNLDVLPSARSNNLFTVNLLDSSNASPNEMTLQSVNTHLVTVQGNHSFSYSISTPSFRQCLPDGICFDCVYDLTISVKDECGVEKMPGGVPITQQVGTINTVCDSITFSISPNPVTISLPVGLYVVTKTLSVNEQALDYYTQMYFDTSTCVLPLDSFVVQAQRELDLSGCGITCLECMDRLGAYTDHNDPDKADPEHPSYTPGYLYLTLAEYNELYAQCEELCNANHDPCEPLRRQMLTDMSPGGQYMKYSTSYSGGVTTYTTPDNFSLLNPAGYLGNYITVSGYEDENGNNDTVFIAGSPFLPQHLSVGLFVENWQPSWAEALLPYHPEYCYYNFCVSNKASYLYDQNMLLTTTYASARDSGFLNPIATEPNTTLYPIDHKDPYVYPGGVLNTAKRDTMLVYLDDFSGHVDTNIWEAWEFIRGISASALTGNGSCYSDYDWSLFRAMYFTAKQHALRNQLHQLSSCPDWGSYSGTDPFSDGTKQQRFIFDYLTAVTNEDLIGTDLSITASSSMSDMQAEAEEHLQAQGDSLCYYYANQWMAQLSGCGFSFADSVTIRSGLMAQCQGNVDPNNPFGGITLDQVDHVLQQLLGSGYASQYCNPMSVSGSIAPVHGRGYHTMMDDCTCDSIALALHLYDSLYAINSLPSGVCSEQEYFGYLYGVDPASLPDIMLLQSICENGPRVDTAIACRVTGSFYDLLTEVVAAGKLYTGDILLSPDHNTVRDAIYNSPCSSTSEYFDYAYTVLGQSGYVHASFVGHAALQFMFSNVSCSLSGDCGKIQLVAVDTTTVVSLADLGTIDHFNPLVTYPPGLPVSGAYITAVLADGRRILMHAELTTCMDIQNVDCDTIFHTEALPMVPRSLTCTYCLTCDTLEATWNRMVTQYPFIGSMTDTVAQMELFTQYVNEVHDYNFDDLTLAAKMRLCAGSGNPDTLQFCYQPWMGAPPEDDCLTILMEMAYNNAIDRYSRYLDSVSASFRGAYIQKCMHPLETFTMQFNDREYHYTLYYYDQAGDLIKTVPPGGVRVLNSTQITAVQNHRNNPGGYPSRTLPSHKQVTNYRYNTLSQVKYQTTPDGGTTQYWYDRLGRLVMSQNARQIGGNQYSYTLYDALGRVTQVGEVVKSGMFNDSIAADTAALRTFITTGTRSQVTRSFYDATTVSGLPFTTTAGVQLNLRNRVAYVTYNEVYNSSATVYDAATHYTYDIHGNVSEAVQDNRMLSAISQHLKHIRYVYDLISGNVLRVYYQQGKRDQFYHKYEYDAWNRLTAVYTSRDGWDWDRDAGYSFYRHGPLARVELGDINVQGIDYAYTLHGWLKGMNSNSLQASKDIGKDGYYTTGSPAYTSLHRGFARDVAGFSLSYYLPAGSLAGDYSSIFTTSFIAGVSGSDVVGANTTNLYNGNIAHMITTLPNCSTYNASKTISADPYAYLYRYDQLNRLVRMRAYSDPSAISSSNAWDNTPTVTDRYNTNYRYDPNGNLLRMGRWGDQGSSNKLMDSLVYSYVMGTGYYASDTINRLGSITELQTTAGRYSNDLDNNSNYSFDATGNLIKDTGEEIDSIVWNVYGKVRRVVRSSGSTKPDLEFRYDPSGHRLVKIEKPRTGGTLKKQQDWIFTYYTYDAGGNLMAQYKEKCYYSGTGPITDVKQRFWADRWMLYGSTRHGLETDSTALARQVHNSLNTWTGAGWFNETPDSIVTQTSVDTLRLRRVLGNKEYEITNHLGNVLATVTDRKVATATGTGNVNVDYYNADVQTITDYDPYGTNLPGRSLSMPPCSTSVSTTTNTVVSENFASGTGSFTAVGTANAPLNNSGRLSISTNTSSTGWGAARTFTMVRGAVYTLTFDLDLGTCTGKTITVRVKNPSGTILQSQNYTATGTGLSLPAFTGDAAGTATIEFIMSSTAKCAFLIDNVNLSYPTESLVTHCGSTGRDYPFGFGGQEEDDELFGDANSYTAEYWEYDPRIGRRWNADPITYPWQSPYAAFNGNPIVFTDPEGLAATQASGGGSAARSGPSAPPAAVTWLDGMGPRMFQIKPPLEQARTLTPGPGIGGPVDFETKGTVPVPRSGTTYSVTTSNSPITGTPGGGGPGQPADVMQDLVVWGELIRNNYPYYQIATGRWTGGLRTLFPAADVVYIAWSSPYKIARDVYQKNYGGAAQNYATFVITGGGLMLGMRVPKPGSPEKILKLVGFGDDAAILESTQNLIPKRGWYDVVIHGTEDGMAFTMNGNRITAVELYEAMLKQGYQQGTRIRLISCYAGSVEGGAAQQLSALTQAPVMAPQSWIYVLSGEGVGPKGYFLIGDEKWFKIFK